MLSMRALLCLVVCLLAALVSAQGMDPMGMQRDMFTAPSMMMMQPDLKKELKLAKDQDKKISEISKAHMKKMQEMSSKARGNDLSNSLNSMAEMQAAQAESDKAILAALNPEQTRRLRQLQWQILGSKALYEADLQKELALTEEQVGKIEEHRSGDAGRMMEAMQSGGGSKMANAIKKVKAESAKILIGFLTPEQAAKYKEALGPESKAAKRMSDQVF